MSEKVMGRLWLAGMALAWSAVGFPVLVGQIGGGDLPAGSAWWWGTYLAFGVCMFSVAYVLPPRWSVLGDAVVVLQIGLGMTVFALAPSWGFTAVLLGCSIATAGFVWRMRLALVVTAAQGAVILGTMWPAGVWMAIVALLAYSAFFVFIALMVESMIRESESREELARVNAELERAQQMLAESARSTERLRIARELHDLVGHQLTSLALDLEVAGHHSTGKAHEQVEQARRTAKALLADVREVVSQFREPPVDLRAELDAVVQEVRRPAVHLDVPDELALIDPQQAHTIVRCVQELVTNAARHSDARNLWIEISSGSDGLALRGRDDGCGAPDLRPGNGLAGMRERFELVGGAITFDTAAGRGFAVQATMPR